MAKSFHREGFAALVVACLSVQTPLAAQQRIAASPAPVLDQVSVSNLTGSLRRAIAALPKDATQADFEAALVFAIDQSGQSAAVVVAALNQVGLSDLPPQAQLALNSVRATRARLALRGTGSIAGGPEIGLAFGQALSINGGSQSGTSDYGR